MSIPPVAQPISARPTSSAAIVASTYLGIAWGAARMFPFFLPNLVACSGGTFAITSAVAIGSAFPDSAMQVAKCAAVAIAATAISAGISQLPLGDASSILVKYALSTLCVVPEIIAIGKIGEIKNPIVQRYIQIPQGNKMVNYPVAPQQIT